MPHDNGDKNTHTSINEPYVTFELETENLDAHAAQDASTHGMNKQRNLYFE